MNKIKTPMLPDETVMSKIYLLRGQKVMIDRDLSDLYGVGTKQLKQAVRRNITRFPDDFMFEMTLQEFEIWKTQILPQNSEKRGLGYRPFCFTEAGVAMLSSILNSETAINVNIQIIRVFTKMRELMSANKEILFQIEKIERKLTQHDEDIARIFGYLKQLLSPSQRVEMKKDLQKRDELK